MIPKKHSEDKSRTLFQRNHSYSQEKKIQNKGTSLIVQVLKDYIRRKFLNLEVSI